MRWRGAPVWVEGRPLEGGRGAVVIHDDGGPRDLIDAPFSARSRVHEYGGGALFESAGRLFFINDADQDIYEIDGDTPKRLSNAPGWRFADGCADPESGVIIAVGEQAGEDHHPENLLVAIGQDHAPRVIVDGHDFFAAPRLSPDGQWLAWLSWDLPHMPWENASLWRGRWDGEHVSDVERLSHDGDIAYQPEWSESGVLHAVLERGGESAVYCFHGGALEKASEVGGEWLRPQWALGDRSYYLAGETVCGIAIENGAGHLALGAATVDLAEQDIAAAMLPAGDRTSTTMIVNRHHAAPAVMRIGSDAGQLSAAGEAIEAESVSVAKRVSVETKSGPVHALYYPPTSKDFSGPSGELPPMIVSAHGGPTGSADRGLKFKIQFWTSRGFAWCDVDYRGSTGYGAAYRKALDGLWGIIDADDMAAVATGLAEQGLCDGARLFASGSSAGGFSVLQALIRHRCFAAGTSIYGVADPRSLMETTHKFEAGYFDSLFGLSADNREIPADRIPADHASEIPCPMLFLQGLEDKVVPPDQSESMARALKAAGRDVALRMFEGEGHGFRSAPVVAAALETEYAFYAHILGLDTDTGDILKPYWL